MELIELNRRSNLLICKLLNIYSRINYFAVDRWKFRTFTKKNVELKNIHAGETVYIIGNGPSVKKLDLEKLKGKHIITVNKSISTEMFKILEPEYHCVIVRYILNDTIDAIKKVSSDPRCATKFLLHRTGINRIGFNDNVYFIYNRIFPCSDSFSVDLTTNACTFYNVLPFTAYCAIYMGFKRIVLLGNDFSFFTARKGQHFYDIEKPIERNESLYQDLMGCSIVLQQYRVLNMFCQKHNIEIVNATENSLLDEIKQVRLDDYL